MVYAYAFDGIMPPESTEPTALALFLSFKPQIDFNVKRYESYRERGKKGGAPKGNNNARKKPKEEESEETEQLETSKNNLKQAETSCEEVKQANEDIEQGKTTKNDLISISESINNNSVDVVADNAHARERENNRKFLDEFFKETNRAQIEVICMQLHTNPETLRSEAEEVIAEWELTKVTHNDYKEQAQHLINQLRIKYRSKMQDNGRGTKTNRETTATTEGKFSGICGSNSKKKTLRSTI